MISFPFWVFLKIQLLVQFTRCVEEKRGGKLASGNTLASKASQLVNLQYVKPKLKYIAGERKTWKSRDLDDVTETVSELKLF